MSAIVAADRATWNVVNGFRRRLLSSLGKITRAMLNPRLIVRFAALGVTIAAAVALAMLGFWAYDLAAHRSHWPTYYREFGVIGLFAIVPTMFLWAAFRAWKRRPWGILSLSSCYTTVGVLTLFIPLHELIFYRGDHTVRNIMLVVVSIPLLIVGVLVFAGEDTNSKHFAQPSAAPNGGPATQLGNSDVREGPPSVS